jgi:hypothetical protein
MRRTMRYPIGIVLVLLAGCVADGQADGPGTIPPAVRDGVLATVDPNDLDARDEYYRRRNDLMIGCMTQLGFEYVAYTPPPAGEGRFGLTLEEFRRTYGFGISTLIDRDGPEPETPNDPNLAIIAQLSPAAQDAYLDARIQCELEIFDTLGPNPYPGAEVVPTYYEELQNRAIDLMRADPRIARAAAQAHSCMVAQGFSSAGDDIIGDIARKAEPFIQKYQSGATALVAQGRQPSDLTVADVLTPDELRKLRELQQYEIAAATAQWECNKDYVELQQRLVHEYLVQIVSED